MRGRSKRTEDVFYECIKTDLLPYFDFSLEEVRFDALGVNPFLQILPLSAKSGEGVHAWIHWLQEKMAKDQKS